MAKGLITDRAFVPVQCSMQAAPLREEQLRQALTGSVQLDATTLLHGHPIRKGYVFWQEDITELVALLEELRLTQEELHDIGDIIQAETAQKAQWLKLSEQNRLYDKIETVTARQLARIQEYLIALKATDDVDTARRSAAADGNRQGNREKSGYSALRRADRRPRLSYLKGYSGTD